MNRRTFLRSGAALAVGGSTVLVGCSDLLTTGSQYAPPLVEDRPKAVYVPSHREGMKTAGMKTAKTGRLTCALTYSYPHRFWTVTGEKREKVSIENDDSIHLMVSVWDGKTGVYGMDTSPTVRFSKKGGEETTNTPWTMLSQNMGFHAGDNVSLSGSGSYNATVEVPAVTTQRLRGFEDEFGEKRTFDFEFEYSEKKLKKIPFSRLPDRKGNRNAIEPMKTEMLPLATAPSPTAMPGTTLGEKSLIGATFVVTAIEDAKAFGASGKTYLAVSPRTPYNGYVLPGLSLSGSLTRDGKTVFDGPMTAALDPALDYHYGATVSSIESGDELELVVETPPQVARHEGYETAFLNSGSTTLTV